MDFKESENKEMKEDLVLPVVENGKIKYLKKTKIKKESEKTKNGII